MEVALRQVEVASDFAGQSGEALTHIVNSVELAADQVRAIATASEQQSATSDEINQTIVKINDISMLILNTSLCVRGGHFLRNLPGHCQRVRRSRDGSAHNQIVSSCRNGQSGRHNAALVPSDGTRRADPGAKAAQAGATGLDGCSFMLRSIASFLLKICVSVEQGACECNKCPWPGAVGMHFLFLKSVYYACDPPEFPLQPPQPPPAAQEGGMQEPSQESVQEAAPDIPQKPAHKTVRKPVQKPEKTENPPSEQQPASPAVEAKPAGDDAVIAP